MMKILKKFTNIALIIGILFSTFIPVNINATDIEMGTVTDSSVRFRTGPTTTGLNIITELNAGARLEILGSASKGSGCDDVWYHAVYDGTKGYICSEYVKVTKIANENINTSFETQLKAFPTSYHSYLKALNKKYPTWNFQPLNTNVSFSSAVTAQSVVGKSFIQGPEGYRSTLGGSYNYLTDKFIVKEGSNWYAANEEVVAYYLDPRNFLDESTIFMFEDLTYHSNFQTKTVVERILKSNYLKQYTDIFMNAANTYNVSPIHLAARVRQEVGLNGSPATTGERFTYGGKTYSGLYNFFNIGATTSANPVYKGLVYANGGAEGNLTSYGRPWTTPEKSIMGGAYFLVDGYINKGQHTPYLQKFNVNPKSGYNLHTHQYMTNVRAPYSEALSTSETYVSLDLENEPFLFTIPVFNNMPNKTSLPHTGNPNNYIKNFKVNDKTLPNFDNTKSDYTIHVSTLTKNVSLSAEPINSKTHITGLGNIKIDKEVTNHVVTVKAENGATRKFNIKIIRADELPITADEIIDNIGVKYDKHYISGIQEGTKTSTIDNNIKNVYPLANTTIKDAKGNIKNNDTFSTGDKVIIETGGDTKTYTVIIRGDTNSDGKITVVDLLRVQKHLLGTRLTNEQKEAADVNGDGKVNVLDLLLVQKYLLNEIELV